MCTIDAVYYYNEKFLRKPFFLFTPIKQTICVRMLNQSKRRSDTGSSVSLTILMLFKQNKFNLKNIKASLLKKRKYAVMFQINLKYRGWLTETSKGSW